jgi:dynactin 1
MRITIEDLESLKELSDELEENHMETEKQLHEDLGTFLVLGHCLQAMIN